MHKHLLSLLLFAVFALLAQTDDLCKFNFPPGNTQSYDLSSLRRASSDYVTTHNNLTYNLNLCGPIVSSPCWGAVGIAACESSYNSFDAYLGLLSTQKIQSDPDDPKATFAFYYESGEFGKSFKISFYCSSENSDPTYVGQTDQFYQFAWNTPLACPTNPNVCQFVYPPGGSQKYDLSPLRKASDDYVVVNQGIKYILNLCGPVNHSPCVNNSAIAGCESSAQLVATLGTLNTQKIRRDADPKASFAITFAGGQYGKSFKITFYCSNSTAPSAPTYVTGDGRFFRFAWSTPLACPTGETKNKIQVIDN